MTDNFIRDESSDYGDGIMLNFYNGTVSLCRAKENKDGKVYMEWVFPQDKDRNPRKKSIPCGVMLGKPRQAIDKLKTLIEMISEETGQPGPQRPSYPDDTEPPF